MEIETLGIVLGAVLPIYPVLFKIHQKIGKYDAVSYTHLTLPTNREV